MKKKLPLVRLWGSRDEEMSRIHQLNNIVRYNTRNKINPESVASHSFFASYFVLSICRDYLIEDDIKLLALESIILHDVPEVFINDITYDCKKLIPEIDDVLEPFEHAIISQLSESASSILFGHNLDEKEKLAKAIVEWADVLSVKQYAISEVELGNKPFKHILASSKKRVKKAEHNFKKALVEYLLKQDEFYSTERGV